MVIPGAGAAGAEPCRPRSARYAEKGYPNYAEDDQCLAPRWRKDGTGGRAKANKPEARRGRKRGLGDAAAEEVVVAAGKAPPPILQREEAVAQDQGRKRRMTGAAASVAAAGKAFPLIADEDDEKVEVSATEGGGDERGAAGVCSKNPRLRVMKTLRAFSTNYLHFVQEEQRRAESVMQELKACGTLKRKNGGYQEAKRPSKRPDLKALTKMQKNGAVLYQDKRIGHLPGTEVGDQFYSRAEMVALGIHSHWLKGIDYMGMEYRDKKGCENFTFPLAICIVMSGAYEDDVDNADEIIYTGQGGNNWLGNRRQKAEQTLFRGNLALKVVDYCQEKGVQGHLVYKYRLKRLEGQPPLTTSQVLFAHGDVPMPISELPGLVCEDISNGQENFRIPATNLVDNPPIPPSGFVYSKLLQIPKDIKIPIDRTGCDCRDCSSSKNCDCAKRNGSDLPYVSTQRKSSKRNGSKHNSIGRLVEPKPVVYECGTTCTCHCNCVNRTSQQGLKYRLEVFKTKSKGWGVRTWDTILPGALICEYTGVLRRTTEVEGLLENNYIFDIDCLQTMEGLDGREQRAGSELHMASLHSEHGSEVASRTPEYCIDAGSVGNIARFINHSCQPNLFIQCVLSSHSDIKLAKVMLFAADTIPPLQELSYDYGYRLDSVTGADGNIVKLACHCGASDCRKRLY
ncbi:histone-lysine N-methyltransferase, H3 lysine-9 specific SUVH4-like isoform X2 [Miscanthus floridulus]|uniref:histone-lysine N-methyltransferase, H3 lysine-9 specific SUVH4-like isoform X2 n=1 Tax=Miscanthus floridulus TaxID=154761 RepID=UPI003459665E